MRKSLGFEQFYLLGHSWGGILAIEYALKYQPHLRALILSNTTAATLSPVKHVEQLRQALPQEVIGVLEKYERAGQFDAPEYQKAMLEQVYTRHLRRVSNLGPNPSKGRSGTSILEFTVTCLVPMSGL